MLFPVVLLLYFSLYLTLLLLLSSPTTISIAAFSYSDLPPLPLSLPLSLPIELVQSCPHAHLYSATVAMTCDKCCTDSLQHKRLLLYFLEHDGKMHPRSEPVFLLLLLLKAPCQGVCVRIYCWNYQEADIFTESNFTLVPLGQLRQRQRQQQTSEQTTQAVDSKRLMCIDKIFRFSKYIQNIYIRV